MHDLIIALIALGGVAVVGGGGAGTAVLVRRRRGTDAATPGSGGKDAAASPTDRGSEGGARAQGVGLLEGQDPHSAESTAEPGTTDEPGTADVDQVLAEAREVLEKGPEELGPRPRLRDRLTRTRGVLGEYLGGVRGRNKIDDSTWDDLEEALILADVGVDTTTLILDQLRVRVKEDRVTDPEVLIGLLRDALVARLEGDTALHFADQDKTTVWLFVGVNGVGKTTTIGKLALRQANDGRKVVLAAGDTFRAAAAEQLTTWSERVGAEVVRGNEGGDPGAVLFDAVQHAAAKGAMVLGDTAGRLHTKVNLMEELKKVKRVAERDPGEVTEVLLVIDATTGQNGLIQAKQFTEAVGVTGVVLTKLDGTAKGGITVAIVTELDIPIKLVGVGESAADLIDFDPAEFVDALVAPEPAD